MALANLEIKVNFTTVSKFSKRISQFMVKNYRFFLFYFCFWRGWKIYIFGQKPSNHDKNNFHKNLQNCKGGTILKSCRIFLHLELFFLLQIFLAKVPSWSMLWNIHLRVGTVSKRACEIAHVYFNIYLGCKCPTTVIFGMMKAL